ncbi:MAG: MarR family winged helix-turn-helix transcriptional regulator, partial [Candidatus Nitrosopolaris sp.]
MPNHNKPYRGKKPVLQMKILKSVALSGRLSQKKAIAEFRCKPPTISDAFKIMKERNLIEITKHPNNLSELDERLEREKFYKLCAEGLQRFIEENPSPNEFWVAMIWYGFLNSKSVNKDVFNRCYTLFIERFVGMYPLRSCFFLGDFFENLFIKWRKEYFESRNDYIAIYTYTEADKAYKVLECLLVNRGITVDKIVKPTKLAEQDVRNVIEEHSMTQSIYSQFIDDYEIVSRSNRSVDTTLRLLDHLLIVTIKAKEEENEKYELSLLGVLLTLALIHLKQPEESYPDGGHYNAAALNYPEKLPLIFRKWKLLKKTPGFPAYPGYASILNHLLGDKSKEIFSLSVSLGGNKEIHDNIRSSTLSTMDKYFRVYDGGIQALESVEYPNTCRASVCFQLIEEKINEIGMSLKYIDLQSFSEYMKNKRKSELNSAQIAISLEDDLHFIENALADEFSFLFYVGLMRENNYKASDYPITTEFIKSNPGFLYPKHFLDRIVAADDQIRNRLNEWINESNSYQKKALDKMYDIY